jgi:hypothetical protein
VISPMKRPLPDNTQHSQDRDIHAPAGFEPAIPESKRLQNHALDSAVSGIGTSVNMPGGNFCRCHTENMSGENRRHTEASVNPLNAELNPI